MIKFLTDTRITGILYLGLALTGLFVFLFARSNIFVDGNALVTSTNLIEKENLARLGIAMELALVIFQALTAIWFYKLFRNVDSFASGLIAIFGIINAIAILISSAMWLSALSASSMSNQVALVYNLLNLHESIWLVSGIFFGLWLIPMGYATYKAKMPKILAGVLTLGGIGYILSTFILILLPRFVTLSEMLPMFATIGEFWIIGYLLIKPKLNLTKI